MRSSAAERLRLLRILREDRVVELDGLVGLLGLVLVEAGELHADLERLGLALGELELLVVDREQVGEAPRRDVEALERVDGLGILGRRLEDALVARDGRLGVRELLLVGARERAEQRQRVRLVGDLGERRLVGLDELRPVAAVAREATRRLLRPLVRRVLAEALQRDPQGVGLVGRVLLEQLGEPLDARVALGAARRVVELDHEDVGEPPHVLALLVQRDERLGRDEVLRVDRQRLLERLLRAIGLVQLVAIELADLVPERTTLAPSSVSACRSSTRTNSSHLFCAA